MQGGKLRQGMVMFTQCQATNAQSATAAEPARLFLTPPSFLLGMEELNPIFSLTLACFFFFFLLRGTSRDFTQQSFVPKRATHPSAQRGEAAKVGEGGATYMVMFLHGSFGSLCRAVAPVEGRSRGRFPGGAACLRLHIRTS